MNAENANPRRPVATFALCLFAAFSLFSCRLMDRGSLSRFDLNGEPTGTDLAVSARLVTPDDDVSRFFKELMPDSGITPVRVAIRNDGAGPLLIHSANGMQAGTGFEGLALAVNGTKYLPIHPKEVMAKLIGAKKAGRYRRHGAFGFAASTLIPPLAVYLIYNEVDIGRFYRPLFSKSLYPALEDGMFEPVRLEPGRERSGYLYFAIPRGVKLDSCELLVRGSAPSGTPFSLKGSHFMLSRDELPFVDPGLAAEGGGDSIPRMSASSCDAPYGFLFALAPYAGTLEQGLYFSWVRTLDPQSDSLWTRVTSVSSKSASIADASCLGSLAACAVNFKSKSRVYFLQCAEEPDVFADRSFSRSVRHVFLHTGGAFVVTDNGVCHPYNGSSHTWGGGVKLGMDVDETGLFRGRLFAFLKKKELAVFGESGSGTLALLERHSLRRRVKSVIGLLDGKLALLNKGEDKRGDTISLFDIDARAEIMSGTLAGAVTAAASDGSSLVVQLEEGTLVRITRGPLDAFDIAETGYLPFRARVLKAAPHGFIAIGETGAVAVGEIASWSPGALGAVETSAKVR
jgi:hypothetical protein